jgi:flagellar protein FliS
MTHARAVARYQEMDVLTMSPAGRLVLLYSHLVLSLRQARAAIAARDIATRAARLAKALDIVNELLFSLDREAGGRLAEQLAALYVHMLTELAAVDRKPDVARLDGVIETAVTLHQAWAAAAKAGEPG